jgi:formiminoglutamase
VPIYRSPPAEEVKQALLANHYHPYHRSLTVRASRPGVRAGIDCHTMAAIAPPVAPDPGRPRPAACVSDVDGTSCDPGWTRSLAAALERELGDEVRINDPFRGGFITRSHSAELPWIQLELSRGGPAPGKRQAVTRALTAWSHELFS